MSSNRFYQNEQPEQDDLVVALVKKIDETAVYCDLPAYGNMEVMLPTTEINVKRGRRVTDYVKVGGLVPCSVVRIDGEKIDVSMKKCREEEGKAMMERHHRDSRVDLILRTAAGQDPDKTMELYRTVVWPLRAGKGEEGEGAITDVMTFFEEVRICLEDETALPGGRTLPAELCTAIKAKVALTEKTAEREIMLRFGRFHDGLARLQAELERLAGIEGVEVIVVAAPKFRVVARDRTPARAQARLDAALRDIPVPC